MSALPAALALVTYAIVFAPPAMAQTTACPARGSPVAEPYRWYPALDLSRIPFHTGAGPWGPRAAIIAPEPPATRRSVRVNSASQLAAEALVPGTQITVDAEFIGPVAVLGDVTDLDIVVPPGRRLSQIAIGRSSPPSTVQRVRIRGSTPGSHSGGLVGSINFVSSQATDIIIDGVDLNGANGSGGGLLWHLNRGAERVAIVNIRGHSAGSASIQHGNNIVIAGNRIMSGARPREVNANPEGWGLRGGSRIVVYGNRIDGTRYHRVRVHPEPGPPQYAWVADNTFVDPHEARIFSVFSTGGSGDSRFAGVWAVCNRVYAHTTCLIPSFDAQNAEYAMLTFNTFFGSFTEARQQAWQSAHGPGRDYLSGNTFAPWQAPPAWEAPGDPTTAVPLPPMVPDRYDAAQKKGKPCPPP